MDSKTRKMLVNTARASLDGKVIRAYDQEDDARLAENELTAGGWCFGMCVHWIRHKKQGKDFWAWLPTNDAWMQIHAAMARQTIFTTRGADSDQRYADLSYMRRLNISACGQKWAKDVPSTDNWEGVGKAVEKLNYRYFAISLYFTDGGAHAVAACKTGLGSKVCWLDPNIGEVEFEEGHLPMFLEILEWKKVFKTLEDPFGYLINYGEYL